MSCISRYVLVETLKSLVTVQLVATVLLMLCLASQEAMRKGLPPQVVLQLMPALAVETLQFTLPGCMLFAVCATFGRMGSSNEMTALKSLGIRPWCVVWPVLMLALAASVASAAAFELSTRVFRPMMCRTIAYSTAEIAYGVLQSQRRYDSQDLSICVQGVEGRRLVAPLITVHDKNSKEPVTISAAEAELECDPDTQSLVIRCRDGQAEIPGKATLTFQGAVEHAVSLESLLSNETHGQSPIRLPGCLLDDEAEYERQQLSLLEHRRETQEASPEEQEQLDRQIKSGYGRWQRLRVEPHRRLSGAFTCLTFVLVGIPVALTWRQGDILSIFFVCFLPILVIFYPLMVLGQEIATRGFAPPQAAWTANLVLAAAGAYLYWRWSQR